jgi:shikimate kinase
MFAEDGEAYFRRKERELTEELQLVGNMILAPGGGWISQGGVVSLLRPPGRLIYLRVHPATALKRLGANRALRPLLSRPDPLVEMERLYRERREAYEAADATIDTELYGMQRVIEMVAELAYIGG